MVDLLLRAAAAATIEPQSITAFIDCSPLGLCCHVCKVAFTSNETARNHLKSNHVESFNLWTREAIRKTFKELRERSCNNSSLNGWLVGELENGGECSVCMEFLPHKKEFKRHKDINKACTSLRFLQFTDVPSDSLLPEGPSPKKTNSLEGTSGDAW
jgi:hypothetical protein